jgi:hypothetical protein
VSSAEEKEAIIYGDVDLDRLEQVRTSVPISKQKRQELYDSAADRLPPAPCPADIRISPPPQQRYWADRERISTLQPCSRSDVHTDQPHLHYDILIQITRTRISHAPKLDLCTVYCPPTKMATTGEYGVFQSIYVLDCSISYHTCTPNYRSW